MVAVLAAMRPILCLAAVPGPEGPGLGLIAPAPISASHPLPRIAVLPLAPEDGGDPREGWGIAVKMTSRLEGRASVLAVSWPELNRLMEENGLDKRRFQEPATLGEIGRQLNVQAVISGGFSARGSRATARLRLVSVATGAVVKSATWSLERDVLVPAPELFVEPPVLDEDKALAMRDSVSDDPCDGALDRVDTLEKSILDLKARYWALQLQRGVAMRGLKFNPGSTITDPALKKEFYGRMKAWMSQEVIPELTPTENKEFAEIDEKAIRLARRCGIL